MSTPVGSVTIQSVSQCSPSNKARRREEKERGGRGELSCLDRTRTRLLVFLSQPKLGNREFFGAPCRSVVLLSQPPLGQMLQLLTIVVRPAHSPPPPFLALARLTPFSPVRRIWARQRHSFRIGYPKASPRGPRAATRTPTRTRTNVARTLRPLASVATALASAAARLAGAELARRTARTACRPTSATAGACARSMAAFAQKA